MEQSKIIEEYAALQKIYLENNQELKVKLEANEKIKKEYEADIKSRIMIEKELESTKNELNDKLSALESLHDSKIIEYEKEIHTLSNFTKEIN